MSGLCLTNRNPEIKARASGYAYFFVLPTSFWVPSVHVVAFCGVEFVFEPRPWLRHLRITIFGPSPTQAAAASRPCDHLKLHVLHACQRSGCRFSIKVALRLVLGLSTMAAPSRMVSVPMAIVTGNSYHDRISVFVKPKLVSSSRYFFSL